MPGRRVLYAPDIAAESGDEAYGIAQLVKDIGRRMDPARRTAWLTQLRLEFKAKRNFVRDMPEC